VIFFQQHTLLIVYILLYNTLLNWFSLTLQSLNIDCKNVENKHFVIVVSVFKFLLTLQLLLARPARIKWILLATRNFHWPLASWRAVVSHTVIPFNLNSKKKWSEFLFSFYLYVFIFWCFGFLSLLIVFYTFFFMYFCFDLTILIFKYVFYYVHYVIGTGSSCFWYVPAHYRNYMEKH
jgi:hypothetical protein